MKAEVYLIRYNTGNLTIRKHVVTGTGISWWRVKDAKQLHRLVKYESWSKPNALLYRPDGNTVLAKDYTKEEAVKDFAKLWILDSGQLTFSFWK